MCDKLFTKDKLTFLSYYYAIVWTIGYYLVERIIEVGKLTDWSLDVDL